MAAHGMAGPPRQPMQPERHVHFAQGRGPPQGQPSAQNQPSPQGPPPAQEPKNDDGMADLIRSLRDEDQAVQAYEREAGVSA